MEQGEYARSLSAPVIYAVRWGFELARKKSTNSSKSNTIPSEEMIEKLIDRNHRLMKKMLHNGFTDKQKEELDLSIRRDYVKQFWIGCKG